MNRKSHGLSISKAIPGFIQYKAAEALSPTTLRSYTDDLNKWLGHTGDKEITKVTTEDLRAFFVWLRMEYKPRRFNRNTDPLSPKTVRNIWVSLSAFFTWACMEFEFHNPMKLVPAPKFQEKPFEPLSKEQIEQLLKHCDYCKESGTLNRRKFTMRRATGTRDRAIILMLLDTGLRASELCALKVGDVDMPTGKVEIKHGFQGAAKGGKGRIVYLGKSVKRVLWRYLASREDGEDINAPLFLGRSCRPMNRDGLRQLLVQIGKTADIKKVHPHRFRHTFAISYLRAGGDLFTLKALLGHNSLDMVQHYARIAQIDVEQAHRHASPADHWHL
jgi:Site-specific recombinase XerD